MSSSTKPFEMVAMIPRPTAVRHIAPTPPDSDVPPTTTMVRTSKMMPGSRLACAELSCDAAMLPARPTQPPSTT